MRKTPSYSLIILLTWFMKVGEIRAQCEKPLRENMVLVDDSGLNTFADGETVTLKCAVGFQAGSGSRLITCDGNQWTSLQFQCKKKSCGSPGEIAHGRYLIPNGIEFGATVTAQCNDGYLLVGPKNRHCLDNGWDSRVAVCEAVNCLPPRDIQDGVYEPVRDQYKFGEVVVYSCNGDKTLVGDGTLTCSGTGNFDPSPPECLVIMCVAPEIENAERIEGKSPPYKYKEFVHYSCNKGFSMRGSGYLICDVKGWNPSVPVCIADSTPSTTPEIDTKIHSNNGHWIGIGVGLCLLFGTLTGGGVYFTKKGAPWKRVPTSKDNDA